MLGSAIRRVNRGKGNQKLIWLKRLFGSKCLQVSSGEVSRGGDSEYHRKRDNAEKASDYIHYAFVRMEDEMEMLKVLSDCQYHYLIGEHLNLISVLTFLSASNGDLQ